MSYRFGYMHVSIQYNLLLKIICLILVQALCQGIGPSISLSQMAMDGATSDSCVSDFCWWE